MLNNKITRTVYSLKSFLEIEVASWGNQLKLHHIDCMHEEASASQRRAWYDCFNILREQVTLLKLDTDLAENSFIVFEYELPREKGRRPDVLILSGRNLIVLEFKGYGEENLAQIDQAKHYARDLKNYHQQSHDLNVIPFLVLTKSSNKLVAKDQVTIVSGDNLHIALKNLVEEKFININDWFDSDYAPLPSLIQSAQMLFKENAFPQIKKANSAGIPAALKKLKNLALQSKQEGTHHLALITGVPGAGKTLIGLQFVFETHQQADKQKAVFLSGNGPLVEVLQFSLGNRNFVQSVHGFLKQYAHSHQIPSEDIVIYDEAQRAWDSIKVTESKREGSNSEPADFINIANRKPFCLLIGLIGEGQEIHLGEESGISLWSDALEQSQTKWLISCPDKLTHNFKNHNVEVVETFNLTTSLRTHQALKLQEWVSLVLEGDVLEASEIIEQLFSEDYPIYITRDLDVAKLYVINKYAGEVNKTYGLIASSKSKILPKYSIRNDYNSSKGVKASQYYVDENHNSYCKKLNSVVTEFSCQGLELDMPILAWDADWIYEDRWHDKAPNYKAKDSKELRKNSYRVLLTRGRDGLIIFVPNESSLNTTYEILIYAGCKLI